MSLRRLATAALLVAVVATPPARAAEYTPANPIWNRPIEPITIAGNLHYVGAADVSAYLISTPAGHILVDCGFRETVPQIEANMEKLGYHLADIRLLLISHGHTDHMGGMAELKARTGARLLAHPAEFAALQAGGAGDFAFGDDFRYPPVTPDEALRDGQAVSLGGTTLVAHFTPGHTRGSVSWSLTVSDGNTERRVVIAASLSAPGYQLVNNPRYPEIVADFESSFATLRALPCDILLASHSWDFGLHDKRAALAETAPGTNPFVESGALARFVERAELRLREQIAEQSKPAPASQ
jgi:metallo-beta-lactamase class B